jgi:sugar lactone lactonase YvrE
MHRPSILFGLTFLLTACAGEPPPGTETEPDWTALQDSTHRVLTITGFSGPEAVRYDPEADVYFVANFNGGGGDRDANGFISRVGGEGEILSLRFATGTDEHPLHAPRGMFLQGDTLWAADADGVHGFDRTSGTQVAFVDFTTLEPGFLNDVSGSPDGALYVTDTGQSRVYRIVDRTAEVATADTLLGFPNGITWHPESRQFLLMPWGGRQVWKLWDPDTGDLTPFVISPGGRFDGAELIDGRVVAASQSDSTLRVHDGETTSPVVKVPGAPADIGYDSRRGRVAVPYIALDRVDVWQLPARRAPGDGR